MKQTADESRIRTGRFSGPDARQVWDERAADYYEGQKKRASNMTGEIVDYLIARGVLPCDRILDIGGGSGRYAVKLAPHTRQMVVSDLSPKMLHYAADCLAQSGADHGEFVELDWLAADLAAIGWQQAFDLSFSSMCPALRSEAGLDKMMTTSKQWCCVAQMIRQTDDVTEAIVSEYELVRPHDVHNDRSYLSFFWNYLWDQGYQPETRYFAEKHKLVTTVPEACASFERHYGDTLKQKGIDLEKLLVKKQQDGVLELVEETQIAVVLWNVNYVKR